MDHKAGARKALFSYINKQAALPKNKPRQKKAKKPEADFLLQLKKHIERNHGWDLHIIEAKTGYSESSQRYTMNHAPVGYPDLSGNTRDGRAIFIEVKAPGKRSTIRPDQHAFLTRKIEHGCFAICTDSIENFEETLLNYRKSQRPKQTLQDALPRLAPRYQDDIDSLFEAEHPKK